MMVTVWLIYISGSGTLTPAITQQYYDQSSCQMAIDTKQVEVDLPIGFRLVCWPAPSAERE